MTNPKAAEKLVEAMLLSAGWNPATPAVDQGVDLLATKVNALVRIQVKSTEGQQKDGSYRFDLRKKDGSGLRRPRSWSCEVDFVFLVCGSLVWVLPAEDCDKSAIHVRAKDCVTASGLDVSLLEGRDYQVMPGGALPAGG
jgi:hypothetical protein